MSELTDTEKVINFLQEYEILVRKHEFIIDCCGCCDSPWVSSIKTFYHGKKDPIAQHITHLIKMLGEE